MGWLVTLGILLLLAAFPMGVGLRYEDGDFRLRLRLAFVSIPIDLNRLLNGEKKEKKPKKQENKDPSDQMTNPNAPRPPRQKPDLKALKPWIRLGLDFLGDLRRKLRIDRMDLNLILAMEDPCDLAVLYGSTCALVSDLQAHLNRLLVIGRQDVQVQCDFTAEKTRAFGRLDLHITLGRATALLAGYGVRAVRELLSMKKRKGGA